MLNQQAFLAPIQDVAWGVLVTKVDCPCLAPPHIISLFLRHPEDRCLHDQGHTAADRNRQLQELSIFHDVAKALTSSLDLDSILQAIMEKMAEYFRPTTGRC